MEDDKIKIQIEASVEQFEQAFKQVENKIMSLFPSIKKLGGELDNLDKKLNKFGNGNSLDNVSKSITSLSNSTKKLENATKIVDSFSKSIGNIKNNSNISSLVNTLQGVSNLGSGISKTVKSLSSLGDVTSTVINTTSTIAEVGANVTNTQEVIKNTAAKNANSESSKQLSKSIQDNVGNVTRLSEELSKMSSAVYEPKVVINTDKLVEGIKTTNKSVSQLIKDGNEKNKLLNSSEILSEFAKVRDGIVKLKENLIKFSSVQLVPDNYKKQLIDLNYEYNNLLKFLNKKQKIGVDYRDLTVAQTSLEDFKKKLSDIEKELSKKFEVNVESGPGGNMYQLYGQLSDVLVKCRETENKFRELKSNISNIKIKTNIDNSSESKIDSLIQKIENFKHEIQETTDSKLSVQGVESAKNKINEIIKEYNKLNSLNVKPINFNTQTLKGTEGTLRTIQQYSILAKQKMTELGDSAKNTSNKVKELAKSKINKIVSSDAYKDFQKIYSGAKSAFDKVKDQSKQLSDKIKSIFKSSNPEIEPKIKQDKAISGAKSLVKKLAAIFSAAALGKFLMDSIKSAIQTEETENLFDVSTTSNLASEEQAIRQYGLTQDDVTNKTEKFKEAQKDLAQQMKNTNDVAEEFVSTMSQNLGVNETGLKDSYAMFYNMANGLGFASESATQLSKGMTMLTQDMASFFNKDATTVSSELQSALSGNYETLKKYGIIINETLLKQRAQEQGLKITNGTLSASQKAFLAYNEILRQTGNAQGDMARTINSPANAIRVFKDQLKTLKEAIGKAFTPIITIVVPLLTKLTGYLITAANAAGAFMQRLLAPFTKLKQVSIGEKLADDAYQALDANNALSSSLSGVNDGLEDTASGASGVGDAIESAGKKTKGALASFDKINDITPSEDSSGSDTGIDPGSLLDGYQILADPLEEGNEVGEKFKSLLDGIMEKLKKMGDLFKEGFDIGFVDTDALENIKTHLKNIYGHLKEIFTDPDVIDAGARFCESFIFNLGRVVGSVASIGASIAEGLFGGLDIALDEQKDFIKEKLISIFDIGSEIHNIIGNYAVALAEVFTTLGTPEGKQLIANIIEGVIVVSGNLVETFAKIGRDILRVLTEPFVNNKDKIVEALTSTFDTLGNYTALGVGILEDIGNRFSEFYEKHIEPFVSKLVDGMSDVMGYFLEAWQNYILPCIDSIVMWAGILWQQYLGPFFSSLLNFIGTIANAVMDLWNAYVKPFIEWICKTVVPVIAPIITTIAEIVMTVGAMILGIIGNILDILSGVINFLVGIFTGDWEKAWNGIGEILNGVIGIFSDILQGFLDFCGIIVEGIVRFFTNCWDGIVNSCSIIFDKITGYFKNAYEGVKNIWKNIGDWFKGIFKDITNVFSSAGTKIGDAIGGAFKNVINGVLKTIENTINGGIKLINGAIKIINKLPGVNIGSIGKLSLPRLARGGIVDEPTNVTVGEAGREAIVPLENTAFVYTLANAIGESISRKLSDFNIGGGGSKQPINITMEVDGRQFGKVAIDNINKYQDLSGKTFLRI